MDITFWRPFNQLSIEIVKFWKYNGRRCIVTKLTINIQPGMNEVVKKVLLDLPNDVCYCGYAEYLSRDTFSCEFSILNLLTHEIITFFGKMDDISKEAEDCFYIGFHTNHYKITENPPILSYNSLFDRIERLVDDLNFYSALKRPD